VGGILTWPDDGDESPFRRRLVESEAIRSPKGRLRVFDGDGRFVVRLVPSLQLAGVPGLLALSRRLHGELDALGVALPPRLYVMGSRHRDGAPQGFVVARTVVRCEVPSFGRALAAFAANGESLAAALAGYYEARYETGGRVMPDIRLDQFVFGRIDDQGPQLWFVDLDPGFVQIGARTTNAVELARLLAGADEVRDCVARQWMRFGLGRDDAPEDQPSLAAAVKAFKDGGARLPALLVSIARSDAFRYQKVGE